MQSEFKFSVQREACDTEERGTLLYPKARREEQSIAAEMAAALLIGRLIQ